MFLFIWSNNDYFCASERNIAYAHLVFSIMFTQRTQCLCLTPNFSQNEDGRAASLYLEKQSYLSCLFEHTTKNILL